MASKRVSRAIPEPPQEPKDGYFLSDDTQWGGFINIRLSDEEKAEFYGWFESNSDNTWRYLGELLGLGMKVTLAYDRANDCYLCSFTGKLISFSSERFVTTSRAESYPIALALGIFKHLRCSDGYYDKYLYVPKKGTNWG